jgi:arsenate reductase (glutaredoxin)
MLHVYGIKNCSTVKKALNYLDEHQHEYQFHDFKKVPPTKIQIQTWLKTIDWKVLLNMRGMTWRKLSDEEKNTINKTNAIPIMLENPSIIKRPIVETGNETLVGFNEDEYANL